MRTFNVTNGDPARWRRPWPVLAEARHGLRRAEDAASRGPDAGAAKRCGIASRRHGLRTIDISKIVEWRWIDYMLRQSHDIVLATAKIRRAGFNDCIETDATLVQRLRELQASEVLPA